MPYDYSDIVQRYFEEIKPLFINYLRRNFDIDYDDIMDIYVNVWIDLRRNIREGRLEEGTRWKSYILRMGFNQAHTFATRRVPTISSDDETFNQDGFQAEYLLRCEADKSVYADPEMQAVLAAELSYIPEPCNSILKMYYYQEMSMEEIAQSNNYSNARTVITTKKRCFDKLKQRVVNAVRNLDILE